MDNSPLLFLLFFRGWRFCSFFIQSPIPKKKLVRLQPCSGKSKLGNLKNRRSSKKKVPFRSNDFSCGIFSFFLETVFCQVKYSRPVLVFWSFWDTVGMVSFQLFFQIIPTCFEKIKYVFLCMIRSSCFSGRLLVRFGRYSADSFVEAQSICGIAWIFYCIYSRESFDLYLKDWIWLSACS